ncbi:major capsid protein [Comamonas endophytica]|uniref:Major capsid protein n=1 Tax=Comamonas endophytica TaxID=2949090 RepID=A0ABY6G9X9_9BURK|nr:MULTISPECIES: major capsid protein [unclassified Acidovorax]MCD2514568.1 major capsid protein [Acidovorax sp. D4N7]UYG51145.1 major capsid protein [Acidovorax sp. 5MLIR]
MSKALKIRLAAVPAFVLATTGAAQAAIPENVNAALSDLSTDALTVAGIVLAAVVAVYAFKFIRKGL